MNPDHMFTQDPVIEEMPFSSQDSLDRALGLPDVCVSYCICTHCEKRTSQPPDCGCPGGVCGLRENEIVAECKEFIDARRNQAKKF